MTCYTSWMTKNICTRERIGKTADTDVSVFQKLGRGLTFLYKKSMLFGLLRDSQRVEKLNEAADHILFISFMYSIGRVRQQPSELLKQKTKG